MARTEIVIGGTALSASLAAGTNLVQLEELGGSQMFSSGTYNTGRVSTVNNQLSFEDASATTSGSAVTSSALVDTPVPDDSFTVRVQSSGSGVWEAGASISTATVFIPLEIQAPIGTTVFSLTGSFDVVFPAESGLQIESRSLVVDGLADGDAFRIIRGTHSASFVGDASFSISETSVRGGQQPEFSGDPQVVGVSYSSKRLTILQTAPEDSRVFRLTWED